jgi:hypothetical protein
VALAIATLVAACNTGNDVADTSTVAPTEASQPIQLSCEAFAWESTMLTLEVTRAISTIDQTLRRAQGGSVGQLQEAADEISDQIPVFLRVQHAIELLGEPPPGWAESTEAEVKALGLLAEGWTLFVEGVRNEDDSNIDQINALIDESSDLMELVLPAPCPDE